MIKSDYEAISKPRSKESHAIKSENEARFGFEPAKSDEITSDYGTSDEWNDHLENRNEEKMIPKSSMSNSEQNESYQDLIDIHNIFRRSTSITNATNFTKGITINDFFHLLYKLLIFD